MQIVDLIKYAKLGCQSYHFDVSVNLWQYLRRSKFWLIVSANQMYSVDVTITEVLLW